MFWTDTPHFQTQSPLSGIFHIDKPVNVHINVINAAEKDIVKELKKFDSEAKGKNSTNATLFVEVNNVTNILLNNTLEKLNETLDRIAETVKNNTRLKADRTIQVRIDDSNGQTDSEEKEGKIDYFGRSLSEMFDVNRYNFIFPDK